MIWQSRRIKIISHDKSFEMEVGNSCVKENQIKLL